MDEDKIRNNPLFLKKINDMYYGEEGALEHIHSEYYQYTEVYCNLSGEECFHGDCHSCNVAMNEVYNECEKDAMDILPTVLKEQNGVSFYTNWNDTLGQFENFEDFVKLTNDVDWIGKLDILKEMSDEMLEKYPQFNGNKNLLLENDEVIEYRYLKDYPLIIICKNVVYVNSPVFD